MVKIKKILLCFLLLIVLVGCSSQSNQKQTKSAILTEPEGLYEREFTLIVVSNTVAERFGLPLNIPYLGNPGETQDDLINRVFEEGMETEMIYWGIKVFMNKAEEEPSLKEGYSSAAKLAIEGILTEDNLDNLPEEVRLLYFPTYEEAVPMFEQFMSKYESAVAASR